MVSQNYNNSAKPTALSPQAGRQFFTDCKRAIVFIDGSNWYHKLKKLLNSDKNSNENVIKPPIEFDLQKFSKCLTEPHRLIQVRYYIGKVKRIQNDRKSEKLYSDQQKLIGFLQ